MHCHMLSDPSSYLCSSLSPDTDTPLLARENEHKPIECKKISASAGLFSAAYVAKVMWSGALARDVQIGFGLDGWRGHAQTSSNAPWMDASSASRLMLQGIIGRYF